MPADWRQGAVASATAGAQGKRDGEDPTKGE